MFCTACGQQLLQGAVVCPRCGRPAGVAPVPMVYDRVHRHVQTLGVLWLVFAGWMVVQGLIAAAILTGAYTHWGSVWHGHGSMTIWPFMNGSLPWVTPVLIVILGGRVILSLVTAIALMQQKPWARVLAIVVAVLTLIKPITGTLLGIYTLWVLAPRLSGVEWEQMTQAGWQPPLHP